MLDLRLIRRDPDAVRAALARRGDASTRLDRVLALDARRREILPALEGLRAQQNEANQAIAAAKKSGEDADEAIARMQAVAGEAKALNEELAQVDAELDAALAAAAQPARPDGRAAEDTVVARSASRGCRRGRCATTSSWPASGSTWSAARALSGSRFAYLRGDLVRLELALVRWAMDAARRPRLRAGHPAGARARGGAVRHGLPARHRAADLPPAPTTTSTSPARPRSRWPRCTPARSSTATTLPRRYAGFSPCFRREAGAAGKDTRGIFRVHQFDKVEMFSFVEPRAVARRARAAAGASRRRSCSALNIPYRVVNIAVDDLGATAAKKYDCEAWLPSQGRYRELTSTSNTTDYQARRLEIRYRPEGGRRPRRRCTRSTAPRSRSGAR